MRRTFVVPLLSLVVVSSGANGEEHELPPFEALRAGTLGLENPSLLATPLLVNELQKQHRQNSMQWALMGVIALLTLSLTLGRWRLG